MSTFNGIIKEFPEIRIDFFRRHPSLSPPSACFLSHIHSDHLQGLDSPVLPFVYCSAATKRLLLRMETYPHRINFAKGILEARKQTYRHLKKVLKALPLQTPTVIELTPKSTIRVTLFDANHCPGAVMFLIENPSTAILYTGDIRSEPWWVNSLSRHPALIPYTHGLRQLSTLYLDTTFASKSDVYASFPAKAAGLAELIEKVAQYPPETTFYFHAWTLGYEDAWLALSSALQSRVHVDAYQMRLYTGLDDTGERISFPEAGSLVGFAAGNHWQEGCLTNDPDVKVRIHSCEPGTVCHAQLAKRRDLVWITPIISRTEDGTEVYEVGAGGGGGDLYQTAELDVADLGVVQALQALCVESIKDAGLLSKTLSALETMAEGGGSRISLDKLGINLDSDVAVTLQEFITLLSNPSTPPPDSKSPPLTTTIHFPYSRHSSYSELHALAAAFKPQDICPCTVDLETWTEEVSMEALFGDVCSGRMWAYDAVNRGAAEERRVLVSRKRKRGGDDEGETQGSWVGEEGSEDVFESAEEGGRLDPEVLRSVANAQESPAHPVLAMTATLPPVRPQYESHRPLPQPDPAPELPPDTPTTRRLKAIETAFHALKPKPNPEPEMEPGIEPQAHPPSPCNQIQISQARDPVAVEPTDLPLPADAPDDVNEGNVTKDGEDVLVDHQSDTQTSSLSLSLSAFDSQPQPPTSHSPRIAARISAYQAAKASLSGNSTPWSDLGIRSLGYNGHVEEEAEL